MINKTLENMPTDNSSQLFSEIAKFDNTLVLGHLERVIRLMQLFKGGDIRMRIGKEKPEIMHFLDLHGFGEGTQKER